MPIANSIYIETPRGVLEVMLDHGDYGEAVSYLYHYLEAFAEIVEVGPGVRRPVGISGLQAGEDVKP